MCHCFHLGLDKLLSTGEEVKEMQKTLTSLKPALEIAAADAEVMIAKIAADTVSYLLFILVKTTHHNQLKPYRLKWKRK